ncbi:PDDEXK nuclease domain-containing protein [Granulicella mallensis]|uniref:PDDEXK nuclease domain-containing protein n=1 Tax=Granulicella mallensis TaxID=940614 RepID=UPI00160EB0FB
MALNRTLKDPYNFDFLTLTSSTQERELERGLCLHLRDLFLELGRGPAFTCPREFKGTIPIREP